MGELELKVENATDFDVVCALAALAGFPKGSMASKCNNIWNVRVNTEAAYCIHKQTLDNVGGDWAEVMAYRGPDIIAIQIHEYSPNESKWMPSNRYEIHFNESLISKHLVNSYKIEEAIIAEQKRVESIKN